MEDYERERGRVMVGEGLWWGKGGMDKGGKTEGIGWGKGLWV